MCVIPIFYLIFITLFKYSIEYYVHTKQAECVCRFYEKWFFISELFAQFLRILYIFNNYYTQEMQN